ncbi:MAG: TolC family protein [Pseudomonadota bacterium]
MTSFHLRSALVRIFQAACLLLVPMALTAAELSFAQAQRLALAQSSQLVAQDAAIAAASDLAVAAGERPDPTLSLGIDNLPVNTADRFSLTRDFMTMRRIGLMQEVTRSDKLALRRQRQEKQVLLAGAEKAIEQSEILRAAGKAWLESYYLQQIRILLDEQLLQVRQQVIAGEGAYRGGRTTQADVLTARAEALTMEDELADVQRQLRVAKTALARWVGAEQADQALAGQPDINRIHFDVAELETHLSRHPDLLMLARRIDVAETETKLAEADKRSDWSVELSYAQRGSEFSNMMSLGVSTPLQWDQSRRQNRELAARQALLVQARAERDDMFRGHVAEVRARVDAWQTDLQRLQRTREQRLPLAQARVQAVLAGYRGGKAGLADVLTARRSALELKRQALQLEMQTAIEWVELNFLLPEGTGSTS